MSLRSDDDVLVEAPESGPPDLLDGARIVPLIVDDTDYMNLFWSGKDSLHLSRNLNDTESILSRSMDWNMNNGRGDAASSGHLNAASKSKDCKNKRIKNHPARVHPRKPPPPINYSTPQLESGTADQPPSRKQLPALIPNNKKSVIKLTEDEIRIKMDLLSRPYEDRTESIVPAPRTCLEGPQLSFTCVDTVQARDTTRTQAFEVISSTTKSIRLDLLAVLSGEDAWEKDGRSAFQDLLWNHKDYFTAVDSRSSGSDQEELVQSALFSKLDYKKTPRHIMEYYGFMHRFCLGFYCLVFDLKMQLIGTYDLRYGISLPGVQLCPQSLSHHSYKTVRKTANLLQICFDDLPRNVFAIVPIIFDESGYALPDLELSCAVTSSYTGGHTFEPLSTQMGSFSCIRTSADVKNYVMDKLGADGNFKTVFGINGAYSPFVIFKRSSSDKGWGMRALNLQISGSKTNDAIVAVTQGMLSAGVVPYHVVHIEHCCDCEDHAMTTWHKRGSYEKRCSEVRTAIRDYLPPTFVYSNKVKVIDGNHQRTTNGMSRIGAFEVVVRPYFSNYSMVIYSKLFSKVMPQPSDVTDMLSSLLIPDRLQYSKRRVIRVVLFDSYYKKPVKDTRVFLFKVNTNHNTTEESLESMAELREVGMQVDATAEKKPIEEEDMEPAVPPPRSVIAGGGRHRPSSAGVGRRASASPNTPKSPPRGSNIERKASPPHDQRGIPHKRLTLTDEKKETFTCELMKNEAIQDCLFRHSLSFFKVRCWSFHEVEQWFKHHGVNDAAISNARASGVEDGGSLLALANKVTLRKWGIRCRLTLKQLESSLCELRSLGDNYDPYVIEGFPEDGQDRRGFSRATPHFLESRRAKSAFGCNFEQVAVSNVSAEGSVEFEVSIAGSYFVFALSANNAPYCSYSFTFGHQKHYLYTAIMKPVIVPVLFRVILEEESAKCRDGVPFANNGLLLSLVNMASGKRHVACASFEEISEELIPGENDESSESQSANKLSSKPPKLQRFNSVLNILSAPVADASASVSNAKPVSEASPQKQFARSKKKNIFKKTRQRVISCVIWLPVGKYYSEVDGSIVNVDDSLHRQYVHETPIGDIVGSRLESSATRMEERLLVGREFQELAVIKCHKRIIKRSIRGFQMIYRRYKKTFLFDKMCAYMVMRRGAKNFCDWAREQVRKKKVVKIQSWLRMTREHRQYKHFWSSTVFIQTRLRIFVARNRYRKRQKAQLLIKRAVYRWYVHIKFRRKKAAIVIQCAFRVFAAIKLKDCLVFAKRCRRLFVRYIGRIKAKIRLANARKIARRIEEEERNSMQQEEKHVRLHLLWLKAEQRRLLELRLREIERRKHLAAARVQAPCRGYVCRLRLRRGKAALTRLQKIWRVRIFIRRANSGQKLRYLVGFRSLLEHPELLGATMILLGIWSEGRDYVPGETMRLIAPKRKDIPSMATFHKQKLSVESPTSPNVQSFGVDDKSVTADNDGEEEAKERTIENYTKNFPAYATYLVRPAIKIQSVVRMTSARFRYIQNEVENKGRTPPLFRTLIFSKSFQKLPAEVAVAELEEERKLAQAAIKLQSVARRFSVQSKLNLSKKDNSKVFDQLQPGNNAVSLSEAVVSQNADDNELFFPGYYDSSGCYIYYQTDEAGNDFFGYYDDTGEYCYCDGSRSLVLFSPTGKKTENVAEDDKDTMENAEQEEEEEDNYGSAPPPMLNRSNGSRHILDVVSGNGNIESKSPNRSPSRSRANSPAEIENSSAKGSLAPVVNLSPQIVDRDIANLELDGFVDDCAATDDGNEGPLPPLITLNSSSVKLLRPWSFLSDMSEDTKPVLAPEGRFHRVLSMASGMSIKSDMSGNRSLADSVKDAVSATAKAISLKTSSLKHRALLVSDEVTSNISAAAQQMKTVAEKNKAEKERLLRIKNHKFQIEDAVLTVRGTAMPDIPRLNRDWFLGIFPHTTDHLAEVGEDKTAHVRDRQRDQQEYEMRNGRSIGESTRSALLYPLSKESFQRLNFSVQLADLTRYVVVDICLFIEADEGALVRPDYLPSNVSVPSAEQKTLSKSSLDKTWLPAFRGEFRLDEGAVFGPCGGKMNVLLRPNLSEAIYLTRAQSRRLSAIEGLIVSVALQPVAIPSMEFLMSLCDNTPPPFLPGHVIDAVLLKKIDIGHNFHGAVVCAGSYFDRMLVSSRHKGAALGILEFNRNGECIGRYTNHLSVLKTVTNIIVGFKHVLLCSGGGSMGMIRIRKKTGLWSSPIYLDIHRSSVMFGVAMNRAGIDFFLTVDKYCNVGVTIFENNRLLKCVLNESFANATVSSIAACANSLYLGQADGVLLVLDVSDLINGDLRIASSLKEKIVFCGDIFGSKTPIASLAVLATSSFFSLPSEDPPPGRKSNFATASAKLSVKSDGFKGSSILNSALFGAGAENTTRTSDSNLEGHLLLIGGGDGDPRVRIVRVVRIVPRLVDAIEEGRADHKAESYTTLQEIAILRGHTRAVSSIIVDAAGRFIITASKDDKMFLVWDAFTYTCEKLFDDVEMGSIHGGMNCLFVCSFKPPYLTVYTVPKERTEGWEVNAPITTDGRPEIGMVRTSLWCTASVKGGVAIPSKSVVRAQQYLGDNGRRIVEMWQKYHNRALNAEYKGGEGNAVRSGQSTMSKDIRLSKTMSISESQNAIRAKNVSSANNFIPLPSNVRPSQNRDGLWGEASDNLGDLDTASDASVDPWRDATIDDNLNGDAVSVKSSARGESDLEDRNDDYEIVDRAENNEDTRREYGGQRYEQYGEPGVLDYRSSNNDDEENPRMSYEPIIVGKDPFHGKISHKMNLSFDSGGERRGAVLTSIRPNRSRKYDSDGFELSSAQHRKPHFSDSDSDSDNNIVVVPKRKIAESNKSDSTSVTVPIKATTDNHDDRRRIYSEQQRKRSTVLKDFKNIPSSRSDSEY